MSQSGFPCRQTKWFLLESWFIPWTSWPMIHGRSRWNPMERYSNICGLHCDIIGWSNRGNYFWILRRRVFILVVTKPETSPQILLIIKIHSKERWTNKQIFFVFSTLSTLSLLASAFVPNIYLLAVTYGIASVSLGVMFTMVIGFSAAGFRKASATLYSLLWM